MKQNSQWLSHVRTRSNTADCTSTPRVSPARLATLDRELDTAPDHVELDIGLVGRQPPLDHVRGASPSTRTTSSPGCNPARAAGEPGATETISGNEGAVDMAEPGYRRHSRGRR